VDADWVKICPYLEFQPPNPLDSDFPEKTKDVMEIYSYFKEDCPEDYLNSFLRVYTKLRPIPELGDSKISQMLKAVKLMRVANMTRSQLKELHKTTRNSVYERVLDKAYEGLNRIGLNYKRPSK
jgi:hypothetical protein